MRAALFDMAENDAAFGEVIRRHFQADAVTCGKADEMFAHLTGDVGKNFVLVIQLHFEHRARQNCGDRSFQFDMLFAHSVKATKK